MARPFYVYDNWSAYDELSDNIPLTEDLALFQLEQMKRLMGRGVTFDAYLMDAFWYEREGGYRRWKTDRWPLGPDRWLKSVHDAGLAAGLWFPANTCFDLVPPDHWRDSLSPDEWGFCCFEGGFLSGFIDVLTHWYERGITVFKFDFADFGAAPALTRQRFLPSEIRQRNVAAYSRALQEFRKACPGVKLLAYNGFEEAEYMDATDRPVRKLLDPAWLNVFDSIYCGDPRPADLPQANFWRTLDIYADHMVRYLNLGGIPLDRIDNCALMLGKAGTCYQRGVESWQSTLILSLARGGSVHMTLGNLELLSDADAEFMAHFQRVFEAGGEVGFVGGMPGAGEIYGYRSGGLLTLVNPSMTEATWPESGKPSFSDGFFECSETEVTLGPGAVALLHTDQSAKTILSDGLILTPIDAEFSGGNAELEATITGPAGDVHLGFRQFDVGGRGVRTNGGPPPGGVTLANLLEIEVTQQGESLVVKRPDDLALWSGLSWAYGILEAGQFASGDPIQIRFRSSDQRVNRLDPFVYAAN